jgi:hypothetical protein
MSRRPLLPLLLVTVLSPTAAWAVPMAFDVQGIDNTALSGHVRFAYDQATHVIDIEISNTSGPAGGTDPRITGFTFNAPDAVTGVSNFVSLPVQWALTFNPDNINTPKQIGLFDVGTDSGTTNNGISRTQPFTFSFTLDGNDAALDALTEMSFLSLLSVPENKNTAPTYFSARFQRTGDGAGSDVGIPTGPPGRDDSNAPEPVSVLLLGLGGTALVARRMMNR